MKHGYDTLSEAMNDLRKDGYTEDFNLRENSLVCSIKDYCLNTDGFEIDRLFRFEGFTDPEDQAVLYAISSKDGKVKGLLVHAYGPDADSMSAEMAHKLSYRDR